MRGEHRLFATPVGLGVSLRGVDGGGGRSKVMMKTRVMVWPTGVVEIETTNRHQMATRWIETLKGKKHLRLVSGDAPPAP